MTAESNHGRSGDGGSKYLRYPPSNNGSGWHGLLEDCFPLQTGGELHFHDCFREGKDQLFRTCAKHPPAMKRSHPSSIISCNAPRPPRPTCGRTGGSWLFKVYADLGIGTVSSARRGQPGCALRPWCPTYSKRGNQYSKSIRFNKVQTISNQFKEYQLYFWWARDTSVSGLTVCLAEGGEGDKHTRTSQRCAKRKRT